MSDGAATHLSEIPRMAEAFGQARELECVCARRPLPEEELGDELKSPGDHRRAEVTLTAITSESAQYARVLVPEYHLSRSGGHTHSWSDCFDRNGP